ncbi:hypothetical protein AnigIFM49718_011831 [Aspergillus niger]|nr:hypothetical protein AnigIFM49718_011831 [Aspergillus niger]
MPREPILKGPITLNISEVSAESGGKLFAGYADNSITTTFHGGSHIHQHSERPETPVSPLSTVPYRSDPDFVSRDILLAQIREKSSAPGSRIALVGLGGVGKSQLAIEYSHQIRRQSPATWVLWIHASNAARYEQSFRDIADQVKIPGRQNPQVNIYKLVEDWLQDRKRGKWILILDNVDDYKFLTTPPTSLEDTVTSQANAPVKPLLQYLPQSDSGSMIITSRSQYIASKIVYYKEIIHVAPMTKPEAVELLQKKIQRQDESEKAGDLVEELEFMPLAIIQAAGYIHSQGSRCSISQYLGKFRESNKRATKLLEYEPGYHFRDWEAKSSILATWQISFDYIKKTRQSAADLLSLMSFFDRQGIPENLLRVNREIEKGYWSSGENVNDSSDEDTDDNSESDADDSFQWDIVTLRQYSFISASQDNGILTMHRLVQLAARSWLKSQGQLEQWNRQFISILCRQFPTGEYQNWERCRLLFPHVRSAMSQQPDSDDLLIQWAKLLYRGAWYAAESGNIVAEIEMASKSRKQRKRILGIDDEDTLASTLMLADAYSREGHWKKAEQLQVQVMETRKIKLGEDHPDTLTSMANLASTFWYQGRWEKAEQLKMQVMETRKIKLGEDHPSTLTSMANLASTYRIQGRWEKAEQLFMQVIETRKVKLGEDHPDTLTSMANLASTYRNQGWWKKAEQLEIQVMETRKIKLDEDHPSTLTSMANLASTYRSQGWWKKAEQLEIQVMETRKIKLGEDHPSTLTSMANLASTYGSQGWWEKAEQLEMQVMEMSKIKLGKDHPDTLTSMANLASTFWNQGRWEKAEQLEMQVMETSKIKLGEDHPDTLTSMASLAFTWKSLGQYAAALDLLKVSLAKQKQVLGLDHPDVSSNLQTLQQWETEELGTNR